MTRIRLLWIACLTLSVNALAAPQDEQAFLWEAANNQLASASTEQEYADAARAYAKISKLGLEDGHVFYNMGTALLLSGEHAEAVLALKRAQLYHGARPDIQRNLSLAQTRLYGSDVVTSPWQQTLFWLHYKLSASARHLAAIASFALLCMLLAVRVLIPFRFFKAALCLAILLVVILASSSLYTLYQLQNPHQLGPYVPVLETAESTS